MGGGVSSAISRALGYRSFELADMIANALGVAAGWAAAGIARLRLPQA